MPWAMSQLKGKTREKEVRRGGGKEGREGKGWGGVGLGRRMEMDERNTPTAKQSIGILCLCLTRLSAEM